MNRDLNKLRQDAEAIFRAGLQAVEPRRAVITHLTVHGDTLHAGDHSLHLAAGSRIFVVGGGKAGAPMASAVEEVLGDRITGGLVCVKYGHLAPADRIRIVEAGHPVPDGNGYDAAVAMTRILESASEGDLVICLISGGGSALLPLPAPPVTLEDKQAVTDLLLRSGAEIGEINAVRKHLSLIKGGGLARMAYPARVLTLILSDVVGDSLDVIASGPTVPDPTTFRTALGALEKYGILDRVPARVLTRLRRGADGGVPETPKPGAPELAGVANLLIGTNTIAVGASAEKARELEYRTVVLSTSVTGETRAVAGVQSSIAREVLEKGSPVPPPACIISGGETTVTVKGSGKGGRNQEFALAAAMAIDGLPGVVMLSGGTDGTDGTTEAAGAVADGTTVARARSAGLDPNRYLENNDSYHFFTALGDLLITGPTMTNVMDLHIILIGG
ncbi:MAG: glycerate kinase [bacterium]|nr:MAG: glycerate kinase [bacterium]